MWQYLGMCLVAFAVTFLMIPVIKPVACFIGLVDRPGGRKKHDGLVPLTGGISIFTGLLVSILLFVEQTDFVRILIVGGGMMVAVGAFDDRYDISARFRLAAQSLIAILFTYGLGVKIISLGDLFGFGDVGLGYFSNVFTVVCIVALINALNMLDGIDGLVGTIGWISFFGLSLLLCSVHNYELGAICFSLTFCILAFLVFNLFGSPERRTLSKVFMGDAGSMFLGLALAVLLVRGSQAQNNIQVAFNSPVGVLWFVLLPVTDMATTIGRRLRRGRSPLAPDRTHIHHILVRSGFSKYQVLIILGISQLIMVSIGMIISLSSNFSPAGFILALAFVLLYQLVIGRSWRIVRWSRRRLGLS